jgi:potassium-transporting ATPase potassium-binding subunit
MQIFQVVIVLVLIVAISIPFGRYLAAVFTERRTFLDPVLDPVDNAIYWLGGVRREPMRWPAYATALLLTNLLMGILIFGTFMLQPYLPLNPDGQGPMSVSLAFGQAASFITNTDWQSYSGENTFSYFSQIFGLIFPMFTSAATGLAAGIAFIRGLAGNPNLGNFYVDLTRAITRVLMPISIVLAIVFIGFGVPQTFNGAQAVTTLNGPLATPVATATPAPSATPAPNTTPTPAATPTPPSATSQGQQTITRGLVASLISIKHLGTNGGGWFNANSAHPFENPTPITNVLETLLMALIPTSIIVALGVMLSRRRQAWTFYGVMAGFFLVFLVITYVGETNGNPLLNALGLDPAQGNMEGHEVRFGQGQTALFVTATTAFATGTVDAMHDSLTPLASITPISQMLLNMVFGGKGVGFINLIIYAALGVFLTGLMVGRTPEFLGKKIEAHEVKLAAFAFLMHPMLILFGMALTFALSLSLSSIANPGPHGFSEIMYAYTSAAANNGSAFAGLNANTDWFNYSLGVVFILGRYVSIVLMLAFAGSLAAKRPVPMTVGTMRTDDGLFGGVLAGTVLILGALTFFPVLALGPVAEQLAMVAGKVFS